MEYICPVCNANVKRDLMAFKDHVEAHIADEIKKRHPDWAEKDGVCKKCLEYYRSQLLG